MRELQHRILAPAAAHSQANLPGLSTSAENALSRVTKKARPTGRDLVRWGRSLPTGKSMRQELNDMMGVGPGTVKELIELAIREGMGKAEIGRASGQTGSQIGDPVYNRLGKRAYNVLQEITGKCSPVKQDFRGWISGLSAGTDVRSELLRHGSEKTVEMLVAFAVREGFVKQ